MPTGYTCYIEDGRITTGEEFLKLCLRNFGVYSDYVDEQLSTTVPTTFTIPSRYEETITRLEAKLARTRNMSIEEAKETMKANNISEIAATNTALTEQLAIRERYENIALEIANWTPPTDAHAGIKQFAISQITKCMDIVDNYIQVLNAKNFDFDYSDTAVLAYIQRHIDAVEEELDYAKKCLARAIAAAAEKTKFVQQFLESFK